MDENIAILIGCHNYKNLSPLPFVINDVHLMEKTFEKCCDCKKNILIICNDEPSSDVLTEEEIHSKIKSFSEQNRNNSFKNLYFYFSGHGLEKSSDGVFLLSENAEPQMDYGLLRLSTSIANRLLTIHADNYFLFIDACRYEPSIQKTFSSVPPKKMVVFYSCSHYQNSYQKWGDNVSAFTHYLSETFFDNTVPRDVIGFNESLQAKIASNPSDFLNQTPNTVQSGDLCLDRIIIKNNGPSTGPRDSFALCFDTEKCAYWINTLLDGELLYINELYKVVIVDYLCLVHKQKIIILIHPYKHEDLLHTLNENAKFVSSNIMWTEKGPFSQNTNRFFIEGHGGTSVKTDIVNAVKEWKDDNQNYQLVISISSKSNPYILKKSNEIAIELKMLWQSINIDVLSIDNTLSLIQNNPSNNSQDLVGAIDFLNLSFIERNNIVHNDLTCYSLIYHTWMKGSDLQKSILIELVSHSYSLLSDAFPKIGCYEILKILSSDIISDFDINWDNIAFFVFCFIEDNAWTTVFEIAKNRCSDNLRSFFNTPLSQISCNTLWGISFILQSKKKYLMAEDKIERGTAPYFKLLFGTEYGKTLRDREYRLNENKIPEYQSVLLEFEDNELTNLLFPKYAR